MRALWGIPLPTQGTHGYGLERKVRKGAGGGRSMRTVRDSPAPRPKTRPATGMESEREYPRWIRAVWPSPATCPKKTTGHRKEREKETKEQYHPSSLDGQNEHALEKLSERPAGMVRFGKV